MTEATSFKALGAGNGLPFCFSPDDALWTIDVSLPYYSGLIFTTFSGVTDQNYASFSEEEIEEKVQESFYKFVTLFWNYEGISGSSSADPSEAGVVFDNEPRDRVCETGTTSAESYEEYSAISTFITAFYDGSTFLGYGGYQPSIDTNAFMVGGSVRAYVCGSFNIGPDPGYDYDTSYATVNGIDFLFAAVGPDDGNTTITLTDSTLSVENTDGGSATITDIKFYTY